MEDDLRAAEGSDEADELADDGWWSAEGKRRLRRFRLDVPDAVEPAETAAGGAEALEVDGMAMGAVVGVTVTSLTVVTGTLGAVSGVMVTVAAFGAAVVAEDRPQSCFNMDSMPPLSMDFRLLCAAGAVAVADEGAAVVAGTPGSTDAAGSEEPAAVAIGHEERRKIQMPSVCCAHIAAPAAIRTGQPPAPAAIDGQYQMMNQLQRRLLSMSQMDLRPWSLQLQLYFASSIATSSADRGTAMAVTDTKPVQLAGAALDAPARITGEAVWVVVDRSLPVDDGRRVCCLFPAPSTADTRTHTASDAHFYIQGDAQLLNACIQRSKQLQLRQTVAVTVS